MTKLAFAFIATTFLFIAGCSTEPVGEILTYQPVGTSTADGKDSKGESFGKDLLLKLVVAIDQRLNSQGMIAIVSLEEKNNIEIGVLGRDSSRVAKVKRLLSERGTLEFRITANLVDHEALIEKALQDNTRMIKVENQEGRWVKLDSADILDSPERYVIRTDREPNSGDEILVVMDEFNVTGEYIDQAEAGYDQVGRPCVNLELNSKGAERFERLTGSNLPNPATGHRRQLGIIINGSLVYAPTITDVASRRGWITGSFTTEEVEDLATVFNSGPLPAGVKLVNHENVSQ